MNDCWHRIGVGGDNSCPELAGYVHCRNCPVFADGARHLLDRALPEHYAREWENILAERAHAPTPTDAGINIFRLGREWLALPTEVFLEVAALQPVRIIPHRSNAVLRGLASIRGAIHLCFDLAALLGITVDAGPGPGAAVRMAPARHCVIRLRGHVWVFAADEVAGVCRFGGADLRPAPATVAHAAPQFTAGMLEHDGRSIGVLDTERLAEALHKVVL